MNIIDIYRNTRFERIGLNMGIRYCSIRFLGSGDRLPENPEDSDVYILNETPLIFKSGWKEFVKFDIMEVRYPFYEASSSGETVYIPRIKMQAISIRGKEVIRQNQPEFFVLGKPFEKEGKYFDPRN